MSTLPLHFRVGHLFVEAGGAWWLLDTGAPASFGSVPTLSLAGQQVQLGSNYIGLTPASLSQFVGVECAGLLGADVLGQFDLLLDASHNIVAVSTAELQHSGQFLRLDEFMGIPIVSVKIRGADFRMFFDTGAQVSYFQDDSLTDFPPAGTMTDFYPGVGQFRTETHDVEVTVGATAFTLRCGTLPGLLGATLMLAGTQGIIGNQVLIERSVGFFPRRRLLVL